MQLPLSTLVCSGIKVSLFSRPTTCTMSRLKSASSSSLTPAESLTTKRSLLASFTFSSMAWFISSMAVWVSFITSMYPKPAGLSSSMNNGSNTKGYFPWS